MATKASPADICPTCAEPATLTCAGCRDIKYCSVECRETDWPAHKLLCSTFKTVPDSERPSERMRRVIFFPPDSNKPVFVWKEAIDHPGFQKPMMTPEMGTVYPSSSAIEENTITEQVFERGFRIQISFDDEFLRNYTSENNAIKTATSSLTQIEWRGPVFAHCGYFDPNSATQDTIKVTDMGMKEYSHVIAYLHHAYNNTNTKPHAALKGPKIQAVKVFCDGEMQATGNRRFKAVKMPRYHPLLRAHGDISPISAVRRA